jgi:hypothetical protein
MYSEKINIICLYVREAHVVYRDENKKIVGGWPIGYTQYEYEQHKNLDERIAMAKIFTDEFLWHIPTYVDNFENNFDNTYGAWPDRVFLFDSDGTLQFKAVLEDGGFRPNPFTEQIKQFIQ